jgi:hypothetical protein
MHVTCARPFVLVNLLLVAACASPPETDRVRAASALLQARQAQAELYAPATFKAGQQELEKAETEIVIQLSRPHAFRRFSEARRGFRRANVILRSAVEESVSRQAELRQGAEENLREFDRIATDIENQVARLPDRFTDKKQTDKTLSELDSLRAEVPPIRKELESGDYRSAYYAASNLRTRETLLYRQNDGRLRQQRVASMH